MERVMIGMYRDQGPIRALAQLAAATVLAYVVGCSSHSDSTTATPTTPNTPTTPTATPAITLAASASTLNITQGATANVTVTVTRTGGFAGDVVVTAEGLPVGVGASALTITSSNTSGTVTFTAINTAAVGSATVTLRGSGTGITSATTGVTLATVAPVVATVNATWTFCNIYFFPSWVAFQDGPNGVWTRLSPTAGNPNSYVIPLTQSKGAVAFARQGAPGFNYYETDIYYFTQAELVAYGTTPCPGGGAASTGRTATGSWTGLASTEGATLYLGDAVYINSAAAGQFTVADLKTGTADAIVARYALADPLNADGVIIRRGLNLVNGAVISPAFDLSSTSAELFAPVTRTLTVSGLNTDAASSGVTYYTANGSMPNLSSNSSIGATSTFKTVPAANQAAGDLHVLSVTASPPTAGLTFADTRTAGIVFSSSADQTVALGPAPSAVTTSTLSAQTPALLRVSVSVQPQYNQTFGISWFQNNGVTISYSAGYLGSVTTFNADIPNLSAAGYPATYGLIAGLSTFVQVSGSAWSVPVGIGQPVFVNNAKFSSATKVLTIIP